MTKDAVLITGGAGYIGSHAAWACRAAAYPVVVLDNLSKGARSLVPPDVVLYEGDVGDAELLARIFSRHCIGVVMHLAGAIVVPESVVTPLAYYLTNTCKTRSLLQSCVNHGVTRFVFSSTAAVYGEPDEIPVSETAPTRPASPYGASKLMAEWMLRDADRAHGLRHVILRYFNVAGADPLGRTGQIAPGATHLIKIACDAALGRRPGMEIFGDDYDTPDGTCVRDFIHVSDLARAHISALDYLSSGRQSLTLNCGYGHGYSVREVIEAMQRTAGMRFAVGVGPRRPGDVGAVIANVSRLRTTLDWKPMHDNLDQILWTALEWERICSDNTRHAEPALPRASSSFSWSER